jgi:hypothetical protein
MSRYPGGIIRKTPVTPAGPFQNGAAPGMWTLAEASFWTKQGLWPIAGNEQLVVEDVFSTYLYTGNSSTQTITNGIDLAGKGGLVWLKARNSAENHFLFDTNRGVQKRLVSNSTADEFELSDGLSAFNSNGFTLGSGYTANGSGLTVASWTFRKAPNFFDVVTYTGNGVSGRAISHNLGVAPGVIIVKRRNGVNDWPVYHRSLGDNKAMILNSTASVYTWDVLSTSTPTATQFFVNAQDEVNTNGGTYVAYLFAHDTASTGLIQCGSFTTDGSGVATVTLGWEPQWVLFKSSSATDNWRIVDNMRGFANAGASSDARLFPNSSSQEFFSDTANPTATGFVTQGDLQASQTFIYVAIRRGPMRTPTLGTSVFSPNLWTSSTGSTITTNFPVDMQISKYMASADSNIVTDRLRGLNSLTTNSNQLILRTNTTGSESNNGSMNYNYDNVRFLVGDNYTGSGWALNFRRAPGFMDVVCYTGNDQVNRAINHNLSVLPELIILKSRFISGWFVYSPLLQAGRELFLDQDGGQFTYSTNFASSLNSATVFGIAPSAGTAGNVNVNGINYVAYLFASAPGVSKVGSYTGNGSSQTINCAFTTGARFVLIKRTDSTGDWYVWDSARGIVAGNDPYLALNTTAAQVTSNDSVDTDSTGFVVNQVAASNINVNAATYIFLAIA